ncbi:hypothetical protein IE53DRAFT_121289 [Violaceomyces palustris]|uniref:Uncharacterized protein n=1 Tax=Violaceomyces palustris TaxID=1673888 RepID=A0ACD0P6K9_9BASI|nr:hypothetical protein IE53DRAFT_121289 [Violaceomyces palustris]
MLRSPFLLHPPSTPFPPTFLQFESVARPSIVRRLNITPHTSNLTFDLAEGEGRKYCVSGKDHVYWILSFFFFSHSSLPLCSFFFCFWHFFVRSLDVSLSKQGLVLLVPTVTIRAGYGPQQVKDKQ